MIQNNVAQPQIGRPAPPQYWQPNRTGSVFADAPLNQNFPPIAYGGYYNPPRGYGLDLNHNGQMDKNDGYLAFDLNRDGRYSTQEVQQSRNLLKAFSGDFDMNADGRVDYGEMFQGYSNFFQSRAMDLDRDGVLSNWELANAGGSVVQQQQNPKFAGDSGWRSLGLNNLPGGHRLDYVNPWYGTFGTSFNNPWPLPGQPRLDRPAI